MNSMDINRKNFTRSRKRVETRLKFYGLTSICFSLLMLATLLISIGLNGYTALQQAYFKISIPVDTSEFTSEDGNILKNKINLYDWDGTVNRSFNKLFSRSKK